MSSERDAESLAAMRKQWIPTTEQIRTAYSIDVQDEYRDPISAPANRRANERYFDAWRAAHDAEVREPLESELATARQELHESALMVEQQRVELGRLIDENRRLRAESDEWRRKFTDYLAGVVEASELRKQLAAQIEKDAALIESHAARIQQDAVDMLGQIGPARVSTEFMWEIAGAIRDQQEESEL